MKPNEDLAIESKLKSKYNISDAMIQLILQKIIKAIEVHNNILKYKVDKHSLKRIYETQNIIKCAQDYSIGGSKKHMLNLDDSIKVLNQLKKSNSFCYAGNYMSEDKVSYEDMQAVEMLNISQ